MSSRTAIYDILQAASPVTSEIGTRCFMSRGNQEEEIPFIVFETTMSENTYTKDKTSTVDTWSVELDIYHTSIKSAEELGAKVRTALLGYTGTINSVTVQGCNLITEQQSYDVDEFPLWSQDYEIRIER